MYRSGLLFACILTLGNPTIVGTGAPVRDDPLTEVLTALDQGRHWYAARLLRGLNAGDSDSPAASLLAARADAGRGAWTAVARRLETASWLNAIAAGEGRALLARAQLETDQLESAVTNYRIFLSYSIERIPRALAEIGLARALIRLGDAEAAAAAFGRAAGFAPELGPWSAMRSAEALATLGDTLAVNRLLDRAAGIPFLRRTLAQMKAYEAAGDTDRALRLLLDAADSPAGKDLSADLRARAARIHLQAGDTVPARGILTTAIRIQPRGAREAAELLAQLPGLSVADHERLGLAFERSGAPALAAGHYQEYLRLQTLSEGEKQELQLKIGELLYRAGSHFAAVDILDQLIASRPAPSIEARAGYLAARATYRRGWRREGRARLREIADSYPGTASALNSLIVLGDIYESSGDAARARAIFEEITGKYSGSRAATPARYRLGILAFLEGDYVSARQHFDRLRRSSRWNELRIKATYWAARSRLAAGAPDQTAEAERLFRSVHSHDPFGYYGFLAAERLDIDPWAKLSPGPEPTPIDPEFRERFLLIDLLRQAGLDEEAQTVLETITDRKLGSPEEMLGLSRALAEHGFGLQAVQLGWQAHARLRGVWTESVLRAVYPLAYTEIISAEAHSRDVDPFLVAAIARQESAFAPDVISRAGARGLLQLMPETGRWWAGRLGVRDYDHDLLFHPETNVHLGTAYFADLQRRYGEIQISLVAYNAGPTRARRWRQRPEYRTDRELFAERIPFSETRTYVRNVLSHYRIYQQIYGVLGTAEPAD